MWTETKSYRSPMLLVRVRIGTGFTIPILIPLFLLEQTFEAIADLVWLTERFGARWSIPSGPKPSDLKHHRLWVNPADSGSQALRLCRELIRELRRYGKWRMAEVETGDSKNRKPVRVYVDFF